MKKILRFGSQLAVVLTIIGIAIACGPVPAPPPQVASGGARQAEVNFALPKNSQGHTQEQQNILDRIKVTTDPTKVLWIHLISLDGKIINRMTVAGKITSSGKRLEPTHAAPVGWTNYNSGGNSGSTYYSTFPPYTVSGQTFATDEFLQPDGTFGTSDAYVFWFDPQHRYHQWGTAGGLGYLLTDYPIDLTNSIEALTGMYNADKAASEWQQRQEQANCNQAGRKYVEGVCQ